MRGLLIVLILALSQKSLAGGGSGKIVQLMVHSTESRAGVVIFTTENNWSKAPCSTAGNGSDWAVSLEHQQGQAMYSLLLAAQSQGNSINISGANDCSAWPDRERPLYITYTGT